MLMLVVLLALASLATCNNKQVEFDAGCDNHTANEIQCCVNADDILNFIHLDSCADLIIDWDNLNISLALELNGVILFETTFGFDTPPELCVDWVGSHICLVVDDLIFRNRELRGCLYLTIDNTEIPLGCFSTWQPDE